MPIHDIDHGPVYADATFALDLWDDPTAAPSTDIFIASLNFEPGLLVDTLHPFDGVTDRQELHELVTTTEAELAVLLGEPAHPVAEVVPVKFFRAPEVTSWAA